MGFISIYGICIAAIVAQLILAYRKGPDGVWIARRWALWAVALLNGAMMVLPHVLDDFRFLFGLDTSAAPWRSAFVAKQTDVALMLTMSLLGWNLVCLTVTGGIIVGVMAYFASPPAAETVRSNLTPHTMPPRQASEARRGEKAEPIDDRSR